MVAGAPGRRYRVVKDRFCDSPCRTVVAFVKLVVLIELIVFFIIFTVVVVVVVACVSVSVTIVAVLAAVAVTVVAVVVTVVVVVVTVVCCGARRVVGPRAVRATVATIDATASSDVAPSPVRGVSASPRHDGASAPSRRCRRDHHRHHDVVVVTVTVERRYRR